MKKSIIGLALAAIGSTALAVNPVEWRVAYLSSLQENPPLTTAGMGCGYFVVDRVANTVTYRITVNDLTTAESAAHIHGPAGPGTNAGVAHTLPAGRVKTGVWNYDESREADILAGKYYVNVHTTANPGGELRGQICTHVANLDGAQENPAVATAARGFAVINMDTQHNQLHYYIYYQGLSAAETAAHFHGYQVHGQNAGVVHALALGAVKTGTWNYDESRENDIFNGMTYVNVHSSAFPGGEIRGQVCGTVVPIDGNQEVPPVPTDGNGCGLFAMDVAGNVLGFDTRTTQLSSAQTVQHIHGWVPAGTNGGVRYSLPAGDRKLGRLTYVEADEANFFNDLGYFNQHTSNFPGGEVRGQIRVPAVPLCPTDMDGDGFVTGIDYDLYVQAFENGDPAGDYDFDGFPSGVDFDLFVVDFEAGC